MLFTLLNATSLVNVEQVVDKLITWGVETGKDILGAILIYVIGRFIIRQIAVRSKRFPVLLMKISPLVIFLFFI